MMALMRLVMNPGDSRTSTISLPMRWPTSRQAAMVSSDVSMVRTISSSFILGTGLKKCMPMQRSGREVHAAISVMEREVVLLAKIAVGFDDLSKVVNNSILSRMSSGAASIIRSASRQASSARRP